MARWGLTIGLITITATLLRFLSSGISRHGHAAHRDSSIKPYDDGDHGATLGVSLPAESKLEPRDTIPYKTARG